VIPRGLDYLAFLKKQNTIWWPPCGLEAKNENELPGGH